MATANTLRSSRVSTLAKARSRLLLHRLAILPMFQTKEMRCVEIYFLYITNHIPSYRRCNLINRNENGADSTDSSRSSGCKDVEINLGLPLIERTYRPFSSHTFTFFKPSISLRGTIEPFIESSLTKGIVGIRLDVWVGSGYSKEKKIY